MMASVQISFHNTYLGWPIWNRARTKLTRLKCKWTRNRGYETQLFRSFSGKWRISTKRWYAYFITQNVWLPFFYPFSLIFGHLSVYHLVLHYLVFQRSWYTKKTIAHFRLLLTFLQNPYWLVLLVDSFLITLEYFENWNTYLNFLSFSQIFLS
jgi:hypothetical protein